MMTLQTCPKCCGAGRLLVRANHWPHYRPHVWWGNTTITSSYCSSCCCSPCSCGTYVTCTRCCGSGHISVWVPDVYPYCPQRLNPVEPLPMYTR